MTDYIEREAAISETRKPRITDAELRRRLAELPAADVVPVVRCKDCRFWDANDPEDGWGWCNNSAIGEWERKENCYCAYGAKMEGEA